MSTAHTPGPWVNLSTDWMVETEWDNSVYWIGPAQGNPVAAVVVNSSFGKDDILKANRNLIAAAPDMLEALKLMVEEFRGHDLPYGSAAYVAATTAINKAENG